MDPNLFAIDGERLLEVMFTIVILSFLVERALAVLFENRWFVKRFQSTGIKEPISMLAAFAICRYWDFDALSVILTRDRTQVWGHLVTAGIIAGGSKASVKLFHDVLNIRSSAEKERQAINEAKLRAAEDMAQLAVVRAAAPLAQGVPVVVAVPQAPDHGKTPPSGVVPASTSTGTSPAAPGSTSSSQRSNEPPIAGAGGR